MNREEAFEFYDAYHFIDNHPAFMGDIYQGISSLVTLVSLCCKHNWTEHTPFYVYEGEPRFDEFLNKGYTENYESEDKTGNPYCIWVPYEVYFNEEWEFDHIEVKLEGGPHYYDNEATSPRNWQRFIDRKLEVSERTYEDAIVSFAKKVKERYGDYGCYTIQPSWISEHNKTHPSFDINDLSSMFKDGVFCINPDYIHLSQQEVNALWWHFVGNYLGFMPNNMSDITKYLTKENYERN
jgi:hypothetical protein